MLGDTVPGSPRAFLCCLRATAYGSRRARHGALLHLRNCCGTRRRSDNTSRRIHRDIQSEAKGLAKRAYMIAEPPVASPPNSMANMKSRLGKCPERRGRRGLESEPSALSLSFTRCSRRYQTPHAVGPNASASASRSIQPMSGNWPAPPGCKRED